MPKLYIAEMLRAQHKHHVSFHTPGHKRTGADITELSYSDCLSSPTGILQAAENDIAEILGGERSFILTDGSTSGIFSMVYALKAAGKTSLAVPAYSHPSVWHACEVMRIKPVPMPQTVRYGIPQQPDVAALEAALEGAEAILLTSPDYYGNIANLSAAQKLCVQANKPLLVDGAHGGHLHREKEVYAGSYADMWVDGVHKSLPAMTQGAVVSAKSQGWAKNLHAGVLRFRTTSPSYPIMASVEYAVKYPQNDRIKEAAKAFKREHGCYENADWTKILVPFGKEGPKAAAYLEAHGVYPEFNDGNYIMFYLSPCTKEKDLKVLGRLLKKLARGEVKEDAPAGAIPMYSEDE
ncbi:MAG: aminotransferase class I/II-fold pyridoxal phosphate-dependent enzyme [Clostridia bacterium]|nr:aminotransferase class I/II-fold pyridoxal phosphate-dependent enzyme [Clostridia bacterium]